MTENRQSGTGPAAPPDYPPLTLRAEWTAYSTAFLSIGVMPMMQLIVPLWCLVSLGMPATMIGIAAGALSALGMVFSIHGGAMLDRLGVRRVMIFCAAASAVMFLLYPMVPQVTSAVSVQLALIVILQLIIGFLHTIGWIGCQTQIGQLTKGSPRHMGRFTSITNFSSFFTPPLAGWAWDVGQSSGIGGASLAFGAIALLNVLLLTSVALMPVPQTVAAAKGPLSLGTLLPSLQDYREAFRLFLMPTVAFVAAGSFLVNGSIQIRMNFLALYMESVGYEGRIIGFVTGFAFLVAGVTALRTEQVKRYLAPFWIVVFMVLLTAMANAMVPLFESMAGLILTTVLFGAGTGLGMSFILSLLSRSVPVSRFGLSVGLRTTGNRFGATVLPPIAGLAIDLAGGRVGAGFATTSILFTLGATGMAILALRSKMIRESFSKD